MALIADYFDRMIVNTILVAVDGSPSSVQAARTAVGFAQDHVSKIVVLILPAPHDEARDLAHLIGECAQNARVPCETTVLHSHSPAEDVVAEAKRRHCDLIWLSAPQESREENHWLDARMAVEVLGKADMPVMLYRARAFG